MYVTDTPAPLSHSLPSFLATLKTGLRASHMRGKCSKAVLQPSSSFLQRIIINSECCFTLQLGMFLKIHIMESGKALPVCVSESAIP